MRRVQAGEGDGVGGVKGDGSALGQGLVDDRVDLDRAAVR